MRILLIEDEPGIVRMLERGLAAFGHEVVSAENGEDGLLLLARDPIDLLLLDISLPGLDGHAVLARVRQTHPALPVMMLTARDDLQNKVAALDGGADDYLTKPFDLQELLARVRALVRRAEQAPPTPSALLRAGDLRVDPLSHRAWRGEEPIDLSSREFVLLVHFLRHPRIVLDRDQLLAAVWGYDFDPGSNVVDVYIRYLRRKIDRPDAPSLITTIRGVGYRFDPPSGD
jgi:DNA-binding response OmpR family regulator